MVTGALWGFATLGHLRQATRGEEFDQADEVAVVNELSNWILLQHKNVLPLIKIARLNFRIAAMMEFCKGSVQTARYAFDILHGCTIPTQNGTHH